jgi:hypothetical protein
MEVSGQLHAPGRFTPRERAPGTHWMGAILDVVVKRKIPSPRRESNPRTPLDQPVAQRYTDTYFLTRTVIPFQDPVLISLSTVPTPEV